MTRKVSVKTPVASDKIILRSATVVERLGQPFQIDLEFLSTDEGLDFNKFLGQDLRVSVDLDDGSARHFHAFCAHFAQVGRMGHYAQYRARAVPWLWFLSRTADCRIFQNKTAPDIVKQVLRDRGFTDVKDTLTKTYRTRDYCVQYRETDLNFIQRLMEEEGIYYYFTHQEGSHTLVLSDSYSGHQSVANYGTIEYFPPSNNEVREKDHIHDWLVSRDVQSGKYVLTDYDFTKPRASLKTQYVQKREFPKSDYEVFDYPGLYQATADGDHYAQTRLEALQAGFERMTGSGNARGIKVGSLFKLSGHPRKDQNKEYLVVAATYHLQASGLESNLGTTGEDFTVDFEVIDSKEPFRAPLITHKPTVAGPQTATVVGPSGEEIFTDKYGRVKVKFHWDRAVPRDETSSCWVRVAQIWAGKNWGWMSIPRIGQEVVIDFLEGDPDQPLITGRVYNQDNMPPFELPANKTQSGLRTRSTLNGTEANCNELRFEDKKGSEQIFLHAEMNQDIEVEKDETHWVGHDRSKTIDNDETVHVKRNRTETVDKDESITIGNNRTESVAKDETISIGKNRSETVGENENVNVGKNRSITVSDDQRLTVGKNEATSVGSNRSVDVSKDETINIGKNQTLTVSEKRTTSIGKDDTLSVGKKLTVDVGDQIVFQTGSASITMKKDGTISIKGKDITIEGSGKINVKASSDVVIKGSKVTQN